MSRRIQTSTALQSEFVTAACAATGKDAEEVTRIIAPVIAYLQDNYAGGKLYISKRGRTLDIEQLRREVQQGIPVRVLCRKHAISPRTLQRLLTDQEAV